MRTPGKVSVHNIGELIITDDKMGRHIAVMRGGPEQKDNASFIALAWNCHDELVAALEALVAEQKLFEKHTQQPGMMPGNQFYSDKFMAVVNMAKKALAKAKEAP